MNNSKLINIINREIEDYMYSIPHYMKDPSYRHLAQKIVDKLKQNSYEIKEVKNVYTH